MNTVFTVNTLILKRPGIIIRVICLYLKNILTLSLNFSKISKNHREIYKYLANQLTFRRWRGLFNQHVRNDQLLQIIIEDYGFYDRNKFIALSSNINASECVFLTQILNAHISSAPAGKDVTRAT